MIIKGAGAWLPSSSLRNSSVSTTASRHPVRITYSHTACGWRGTRVFHPREFSSVSKCDRGHDTHNIAPKTRLKTRSGTPAIAGENEDKPTDHEINPQTTSSGRMSIAISTLWVRS